MNPSFVEFGLNKPENHYEKLQIMVAAGCLQLASFVYISLCYD